MRLRGASAALAVLLTAGTVAAGVDAGASPRPSPSAPTTPGGSTSPPTALEPQRRVPPSAPSPTDGGNSPAAPDPHPGRGGYAPDGHAVGGRRLLARKDVLPAGASALPGDLTAQAWVVSDLDTGTIIAARDPHGRYQPASIQKILTTVALLPLLPGSKRVTVSRGAAETEGSHAGLVAGGKYTVDQLFEGLLLVSGNDCAEALAETAGGRGPTVALMNTTARKLGAYDTLIQTPSGLDGWQQLTSAYDMTLFLRAALAQPRFARYDNVATSRLPAQKAKGVATVDLSNQNEQFLTTVPGALAAKTGFTDAAQHTFAGAIERGGHRYGVVLLRAQRYPDDQWVQATRLVRWAAKLPAGTAPVGSLETPPPASAATASGAGTTPAAARAASTDGGGSSSGSLPVWVQVLLALALIAGAFGLGRRINRAH